jgi:hypothetical protein
MHLLLGKSTVAQTSRHPPAPRRSILLLQYLRVRRPDRTARPNLNPHAESIAYHDSFELMNYDYLEDPSKTAKFASSYRQACPNRDNCQAMTYDDGHCTVYRAKGKCLALPSIITRVKLGYCI